MDACNSQSLKAESFFALSRRTSRKATSAIDFNHFQRPGSSKIPLFFLGDEHEITKKKQFWFSRGNPNGGIPKGGIPKVFPMAETQPPAVDLRQSDLQPWLLLREDHLIKVCGEQAKHLLILIGVIDIESVFLCEKHLIPASHSVFLCVVCCVFLAF